ncbi:helix-turn-helix domain-containing protein [Sphingomonas psychrotolerans]|uniref:AraC family transcriptional regulator n=1 Tax=Sphingomonas psychrotolerans TaxID=1327635 RepID=A0A2K8MJ23_9SPHN|nr:helix-turn-helix transcriptional regulator [Sphingomonas psychrotolerans]ATY31739.1 AraC family transcriptional regulator [Sphingomonas psychrotolerans]
MPPDAVPDHAYETTHLILAVEDGYVSGAVRARSWRGPSMLVYNPPGTLHRDPIHTTGGRFVSIDLPAGAEPKGVADAMVVRAGEARSATNLVVAAIMAGSTYLELEDSLPGQSVALAASKDRTQARPPWLQIATEALADLADVPELRVRDLARIAGVHPVHLARVFREHFGCSPGTAIRRTRIERVAAALSRRRSIAALAAEHGFADHAHLTRCFRAAYGVTPSAFRAAFD